MRRGVVVSDFVRVSLFGSLGLFSNFFFFFPSFFFC